MHRAVACTAKEVGMRQIQLVLFDNRLHGDDYELYWPNRFARFAKQVEAEKLYIVYKTKTGSCRPIWVSHYKYAENTVTSGHITPV